MVVASLALLFALGGSSFAAVNALIPPKSVGTLQLKNYSVGTLQLKTNAIVGAKVKNGTLSRLDFRPGAIPAGPQGPQGPQGPVGPQGPQGPQGATGAAGSSSGFDTTKLHIKSFSSVTINAGDYGGGDFTCDSGQIALSGGINSGYRFEVEFLMPVNNNTWRIRMYNNSASTESFAPVLLCYG